MLLKRLISQSRFFSIFIPSGMLVLFLSGCIPPISISSTTMPPTATSLDTPTPFPPGSTSLDTSTPVPAGSTPLDTVTPILSGSTPLDTPTPIPPSPTPQPTATSVLPAGSIAFAPGTTAKIVQATIQPGQVLTYTLAAEQLQPMVLDLESTNHDVTLGVIEPDGLVLANPANKWTHWQWQMPLNGLYTIKVIGGATTEAFALTARVPQMAYFVPGTSSITLNGTTVNGYVFSYALNCQGNQNMTVTLIAPSGNAYLDIFGLATGSLLGALARATTGTVVLPRTQDYVIEVIPDNGQVVDYSLTVSLSPATSAVAENIVFASGTTAGVVKGTIGPGQVLSYTLSAEQYQPMILVLESPYHDVILGVFDPDGLVLASPAHKWSHWQWLLPKTGLYTIQVIGGATTENYTLTAKVPQRISLAPGASSIILYGTTINGYVYSYVLKCNANQTLTVSLNVPSSTAYIDIFGLATGSILSPSTKADTWTGSLPLYQDYVIEVVPRNGRLASYSLTISYH